MTHDPIWQPHAPLLAELNDEERAVLDALWPDHVGATAAITRADLVDATEIRDRDVRDVISALVINRRIPIIGGSSPPYGYYICRDLDELREADRFLTAYIGTLSVRRNTYRLLIGTGDAQQTALVLNSERA